MRNLFFELLTVTTILVCFLVAGTVSGQAAISSKKGVGGPATLTTLSQIHSSWFYNWAYQPTYKDSVQNWDPLVWQKFVPLFYGKSHGAAGTHINDICSRPGLGYCNKGNYYLIGNEPDILSQDKVSGTTNAPLDAAIFQGLTIKAIKTKDPTAKFIVLGLYGNNDTVFIQNFIIEWKNYWQVNDPTIADLSTVITGWHFHDYNNDYTLCPTDDSIARNFANTVNQQMIASFGRSLPNQEIWITEMGSLVAPNYRDTSPAGQQERQKFLIRMACMVNTYESSSIVTRYAWFYHGCDRDVSTWNNCWLFECREYNLFYGKTCTSEGEFVGISDLGTKYSILPSTVFPPPPSAPPTPTLLAQYKANETSVINIGSSTSESAVTLKMSIMYPTTFPEDLVPEVEVKEVGISFSNIPTNSGQAIAVSGTPVTGKVTISGLVAGKAYHWQARVSSSRLSGSWLSFGNNDESVADFRVGQTGVLPGFSNPTLVLNEFGINQGWSTQDQLPRLLADVNGDSKKDIVGFKSDGIYISLANYSGSEFNSPVLWKQVSSADGWVNFNTIPRDLADVNGDSKADVVAFNSDGVYVALSLGDRFNSFSRWATNFGSSASSGSWTSFNTFPRTLGDVNGDFKADIIGFGGDGVYVSLSTGISFSPISRWLSGAFGSLGTAGSWSSYNTYPRMVADVNGDGKADAVGFGVSGAYVSLSTGTKFSNHVIWTNQFGTAASSGSWISQDNYPRVLSDIDNDGKADIIGFGQGGVFGSLSSGSSFEQGAILIAAYGSGSGAGSWPGHNLNPRAMADISGDGKPDIVGFGANGTYISLSGAPINHPPTANAGSGQSIFENQTVVLQGSGSDPDGDPVTYRWNCTGGSLDDSTLSQPTYAPPAVSTDTTYVCTLTVADSRQASINDSVNILVKNIVSLPTVDLKANGSDVPAAITYNSAATLSWTATNATTCAASNGWSGTKATSGSESTGNLTAAKTYTLTCTGAGGFVSDSVTVSVQTAPAIPVVSLLANGTDTSVTVAHNTAATLSWTSADVTTCAASNGWTGNKAISGSESTGNLTAAKTYTLICTGTGGSASDTVVVNVGSAPAVPTVDLKANGSDVPAAITHNTAVTLSWTSANVISCTASNGWTGTKATSGSESTGNLTAAKTYILTCAGAGGVAFDPVAVNVLAVPSMTIEQLRARIAELLILIVQLQEQLQALQVNQIPTGYRFTRTLRYGDQVIDVKYLQIFMKFQGSSIYPEGLITSYFGPATRSAVIRFQERYKADILTPYGLINGTGIVGSATNSKINQMLGR